MLQYVLEIKEDENGNAYISLSPETLESLNWKPGDSLDWRLEDSRTVSLYRMVDEDTEQDVDEAQEWHDYDPDC